MGSAILFTVRPQRLAPNQRTAPAAKGSSHRADGTVDSVDAKSGYGQSQSRPGRQLKWPAMTMEFKAANDTLLQALKPGAMVTVEFVERQPG